MHHIDLTEGHLYRVSCSLNFIKVVTDKIFAKVDVDTNLDRWRSSLVISLWFSVTTWPVMMGYRCFLLVIELYHTTDLLLHVGVFQTPLQKYVKFEVTLWKYSVQDVSPRYNRRVRSIIMLCESDIISLFGNNFRLVYGSSQDP